VLEFAKELSQRHLKKITQIFGEDSISLPVGFTEADTNPIAPKLYSDPFYLAYIRNMSRVALQRYSLALTSSAREDCEELFAGLRANRRGPGRKGH